MTVRLQSRLACAEITYISSSASNFVELVGATVYGWAGFCHVGPRATAAVRRRLEQPTGHQRSCEKMDGVCVCMLMGMIKVVRTVGTWQATAHGSEPPRAHCTQAMPHTCTAILLSLSKRNAANQYTVATGWTYVLPCFKWAPAVTALQL